MRWRVIALVSLGVNIALGSAWLMLARQEAAVIAAAATSSQQPSTNQTTTNYVARRQLFYWQQIESADYPTFVSNLRLVGCPEQTIRDIIIADVNTLFARRRSTELVTPEQQWWRSEPDTNIVLAAAEKARDLEEERRSLLTRLLGTNWETGDLVSLPRPSRPAVLLDGPVLGVLGPETKQAIQEANVRSQNRMEAYLEAQRRAGKEPDPGEMANLRQQTRDDLAHLLSPPELEEYLLRYSQDANDLRNEFGELRFFNATPDEFRAVFRATDALDQRIDLLAGATDPGSLDARKALEDQRENAIKVAIGPERYEDYRMLHDPVYRDAVAMAEDADAPEATQAIYAINLATLAEQNRIRGDTNLTAEQRNIELKRVELEQLEANTMVTGQELPPEPLPPPPTPVPKKVYVLGPGDSAATIALMYGLPVSAIMAANPKVDFNRLKPGVAITIPITPWTPGNSP
jgi:LysM repeat protein